MPTIFRYGLLMGLLCSAWTYFMGFSGWFKDPRLQLAFWVVVLIEVIVLRRGLRARAAEGRRYWGLVADGTRMAIVASIVIFLGSLLFTTVVFPTYFAELREVYTGMLREQGKTAAEIQQALAAQGAVQRPLPQASFGAIGTIVTGILVSLVLARFAESAAARRRRA
jgi:hypothetical protein